jgi:hypothetical protein
MILEDRSVCSLRVGKVGQYLFTDFIELLQVLHSSLRLAETLVGLLAASSPSDRGEKPF